MKITADTITDEQIREPAPTCACACCVDLRERLKHQRPILYGCWCHEYTADERCDCAFCVAEQHDLSNPEAA